MADTCNSERPECGLRKLTRHCSKYTKAVAVTACLAMGAVAGCLIGFETEDMLSSSNQQHRRLRHQPVLSWNSMDVMSCQDMVRDNIDSTKNRALQTAAADRRHSYDPTHWDAMERQHVYSINPTLQRVDRILQQAKVYNKDIVIDVIEASEEDEDEDEDSPPVAISTATSLYASAYGWPVLTVQTNPNGQVQTMCESTKSPVQHYVLPSWASTKSVQAGSSLQLDQVVDSLMTNPSSESRIRLLHVNAREGEWSIVHGASRLLMEGRIDHVIMTLHFETQQQEGEASQVLELMMKSGYLPVDSKDRKQPRHGSDWMSGDPQVDATTYLRHMMQQPKGSPVTSQEVWFYHNGP